MSSMPSVGWRLPHVFHTQESLQCPALVGPCLLCFMPRMSSMPTAIDPCLVFFMSRMSSIPTAIDPCLVFFISSIDPCLMCFMSRMSSMPSIGRPLPRVFRLQDVFNVVLVYPCVLCFMPMKHLMPSISRPLSHFPEIALSSAAVSKPLCLLAWLKYLSGHRWMFYT